MTHHLPRFLAEEIDDDVLGEIADNDAMLKGLGLKIGEIIRFRRYVEKHDAPRLLVNRVSASSSVDGADCVSSGTTLERLPLDKDWWRMSMNTSHTVSYTHLTLPTILLV